MALGAGPYRQATVGVPLGRSRMGLDVTLMDGGRIGLFLDDEIRFLEAFFDIAQCELELVGKVGSLAGVVVGLVTTCPQSGLDRLCNRS